MADQKFPSDANQKPGAKPAAPKAPEAKTVEGKKAEIVKVTYKLENHHFLDNVWKLVKGVNAVDKATWDKAATNPATIALIKKGDIVVESEDKAAPKAKAAPVEKTEKSEDKGE